MKIKHDIKRKGTCMGRGYGEVGNHNALIDDGA